MPPLLSVKVWCAPPPPPPVKSDCISCGGRGRKHRNKKTEKNWRSAGGSPRFPAMCMFYLCSSTFICVQLLNMQDNFHPPGASGQSKHVPPSSPPQIHAPRLLLGGRRCVRSRGLPRSHDVSPKSSGTQYPVYQLSALWEPQKYGADSEVQNSLQRAQVSAKVKVSPSFTLASESWLCRRHL